MCGNRCLGLYKEAYQSCQSMKASVQDLIYLVAGTVHPHSEDMSTSRRGVRMEFWRWCVYGPCMHAASERAAAARRLPEFTPVCSAALG